MDLKNILMVLEKVYDRPLGRFYSGFQKEKRKINKKSAFYVNKNMYYGVVTRMSTIGKKIYPSPLSQVQIKYLA